MPVLEEYTHIVIISSVASVISAFASSIMIYVLFQTTQKLTTTLHRLLFGMAVSDIIHSLCIALGTVPAPSDTPSIMYGHAFGNQATCNTQGFLFLVFGLMSGFYNCSLNIYFLSVIKYNISNNDIKKKIEPAMHILPSLFSFSMGIAALSKDYINANFQACYIAASPNYCLVDSTVECERGDKNAVVFRWIAHGGPLFIFFVVIISSMSTIYYIVWKQDRVMSTKYRSTRFEQAKGNSYSGSSNRSSLTSSLSLRKSVTNSRRIMHKAIAYVTAFLLSYSFALVNGFIFIATGKYNDTITLLFSLLYPMQGLYNLVVFIFPRVTKQLRGNKEFNLLQGIVAAIQARPVVARSRRSWLFETQPRKDQPKSNALLQFQLPKQVKPNDVKCELSFPLGFPEVEDHNDLSEIENHNNLSLPLDVHDKETEGIVEHIMQDYPAKL